MDKLKKHHRIVREVITEIYERYINTDNKDDYIFVQDEKSRNYLLLMNTWLDARRFYGILIHFQIMEDGLIYVQDDNTDLIVVDWLLERGIAKKDMVLAWHEPSMRSETEFAVA